MNNLVPTLKLTIAKSDGGIQDNMSVAVTDSVALKAPTQGPGIVTAGATGSNCIIVPATTESVYLYVRHTGTSDGSSSTTDEVDVENTDNEAFARLKPGEFLMTVIRGTGTTVARADTATVTVEYAAVEIDSNA